MRNMRSRLRLKLFCVLVALIFTGSAPVAGAASLAQYLDGSEGTGVKPGILAVSEDIRMSPDMSGGHETRGSRPSRFNMSNMHKYLGYGTLLFAAAAGVSGGDNGFHKAAGGDAALMAIAASATGYYEYGHYFNLDDGFSKYNIHIVLATLATVGFAVTAASAISDDNSDHAAPGVVSTGLAAVPVLLLKF
jgi:hypothetical protein